MSDRPYELPRPMLLENDEGRFFAWRLYLDADDQIMALGRYLGRESGPEFEAIPVPDTAFERVGYGRDVRAIRIMLRNTGAAIDGIRP